MAGDFTTASGGRGRTRLAFTGPLAALARIAAIAALAAGPSLSGAALAQTAPAPAPVESQPLPPPPGTPAPPSAAPATPAPAPAPAPVAPPTAQAAPASNGLVTLAPAPADPSTPDEVTLESRPSAVTRGMATWDEGYEKLTQSFAKLQSEMSKAGVKITGNPVATFLETDDMGFRFEAQLPIEAAPASRPPELATDIQFGQTPAGRAIRFVHKAPYDDIDSTYEAISAYLDAKGIEVKDNFTEEYVNQGQNAGDAELELFIYVLPK
ncbi:GyrI-like domain-containing protein [Alsobacter sp. KACC 23698]|uniref:GyrI-like domain-containing protein n=1 Tax=Alsobacter sp. KACC 23698 TaxID=3149229 RepID=A0AAU7JER5_9HYPH